MSKRSSRNRLGSRSRSLNKLIWVIPEGKVTEYAYFRDLKDTIPRNGSITLDVAKNPRGGSAMNLISVAEKITSKVSNEINYEVWIVLDDDRRKDRKMLLDWVKDDKKNKQKLAVSNPMFELWLLLHFNCKETYSTKDEYCKKLEEEISKIVGKSYKYRNKLDSQFISINRIKSACNLARGREISTTKDWPKLGFTNVDLLLKRILNLK